ncbi:MAG: hypothetical protein QOD63_422, partial [Actinomycetota bacterium]|nr:hypothetical protein [Actinomycetota bacterium]
KVVQPKYQASLEALEADYPSYDDEGHLVRSAAAAARTESGGLDHYERFLELRDDIVADVVTWKDWFDDHGPWTAVDLQTSGYDPGDDTYHLPSTEAVAAALREMASPEQRAASLDLFSTIACGSIAGVTTVLDTYFAEPGKSFPYPSMVGSGDRMAICWAVLGEAPNLAVGIDEPDKQRLYHCCQGLDLSQPGVDCAAKEIFHACRGSNLCMAQGGCGFVQKTTGGGLCGFLLVAAKDVGAGEDEVYSAPSDNKCGTFGGCAVPISASQILPTDGTMQLFDFPGPPPYSFNPIDPPAGHLAFKKGENVHDVAYKAYLAVVASRAGGDGDPLPTPPPEPPAPNTLRLVFPPST